MRASQGMSVLLVIVDWFSKAYEFVLAKEMVNLLPQHVVQAHGFLSDVLSDQESQFLNSFCKAFCYLVGATVSLLSGVQWSDREV